MNKFQKLTVSLFALVFSLLFFWISWLGTTEGYFTGKAAGPVALIAGGIILLSFGLSRIGERSKMSLTGKGEALFLIFFFCVYLGIQIYVASEMYSRPGAAWDFNIVAGHAINYGNYTGTDAKYISKVFGADGKFYFSAWPNNAPLYVFLAYFFRLFAPLHIDLNFVGIGLNIFCIDLSLLLLYFAVKKATKRAYPAWIALMLACLHGAFLIYVPIYYTDTITLPCAIGALHLWQCARDTDNRKKEMILYVLSAAVLAVGSVLKFSVAIFFIAMILAELFTQSFRRSAKRILVLLAVFLVLFFGLQYLSTHNPIVVVDKSISYVPKLHWVMMGLSGNGDYNDADYQATLSVPVEGRDQFVRSMIVKRVKDLGFSGMLRHLHEKTAFVWGEGTYFSSVKIDRCRAKASWIDRYVNYLGKEFLPYATFSEGLMVFTELMLSLSGAYLLFKKEKNPDLVLAEIAVFGLFLFECIWEARSRYLFNFLPVFIFLSAVVLQKILERKKEK